MPVTAIGAYSAQPLDSQHHFNGAQLVYLGWDRHLMFCAPFTFPLPPDMAFADFLEQVVKPAIAPHLAAREAGVALTVQSLLKPMQQMLAREADFTLIEGAGGWRVPLADQANLSDLAMALKLPVILVVGVRLGCISHALLTAEAIARDGLSLAGWVANIIDPKTSRLEENLATLAERLPAPCLGRVPKLKHASAEAVAEHLQLDLLD